MPARPARGRRRVARAALVVGLLAGMLAFTTPRAAAEVLTPFTVRFQANDNGAIRIFGNNVVSCPESDFDCARAKNGTGSDLNDNNFRMAYVDVDGVLSTFNSSRS